MNAYFNELALVSKVAFLDDKRAFDQLVKQYQSPVRRLFLKLTLGDNALSDDLAQETFFKAYINIASFMATARFGTWLYRVGYNVFLEHTRKAKITLPENEIPDEGSSGNVEDTMDIDKALSYLRTEERLCITLSFMNGLPHGEIAKITGMPEGTVKTHISRGKEKLKAVLK